MQWANLERAKKHGAELYFSMNAQQLVKEGERVSGIIAKDSKGKYIRFNAKKGVILSSGDFGSNKAMVRDLLTDISELFDEGEDFQFGGRDGRGIQMGVWAGGRMEARPVPSMVSTREAKRTRASSSSWWPGYQVRFEAGPRLRTQQSARRLAAR